MSHTNVDQTLAKAMVFACNVTRDPRNPDCLDELEEALNVALAEVSALRERIQHPVDLRFLSPCPSGYDTVLGFIAKHNPGLLEFLDQVPEATQRDGFWLRHRAREEGIETLKVDACSWLRSQGIETVNAYPLALLVRRFGS